MNVISGLRNSGFLAQSAYSAAVATKDDLGRDITATYLTSHQDLSDYAKSSALNDYQTTAGMVDYQTIEGMTAYQPAGSYATTNELEQVSADITATIPSTAGLASESYVQTNSAVLTGMIDGKQDTLTFGYDEQDRINSINSSALAGGGDVPEDVMVESGLEYNAVNEISGYNGSAIAQYGAEKQWLVHDDTLVHAANSAQYALGVNLSAVAQLLGVDETVLWEATATANVLKTTGVTITATEPFSSFNYLKVWCLPMASDIVGRRPIINEIDFSHSGGTFAYLPCYNIASNTCTAEVLYFSASNNSAALLAGTRSVNFGNATTGITAYTCGIKKIVGIGRKS